MAKGILKIKVLGDATGLDKTLSGIGSGLGKMGVVAAGAGVLAGGAFVAMGAKAISAADRLQNLSDKTGLSAERLQELSYIGDDVGVSLEDIAGAQAKLTKSMNAGRDGTGTQAEAFKTLGINVTDSNGNLRDAKKVMLEAFDALNGVGNETERDALAMQIFGKSAQELNPLIKAGSDHLNKLGDEARKSGAVMSNEAVKGLDAFGDGLSHIKDSVMGAFGEAFSRLMPIVQPALDALREGIGAIGKAFDEGGMRGVFDLIVNTIKEKLPIIGAKLLELGEAFIKWIGPMIPPMLLKLGELMVSLGQWFIGTALPFVVEKLVEWAKAFAAWIGPALPGILKELGIILLKIGEWILLTALPTIVINLGKMALGILEAIVIGLTPLVQTMIQPFIDAWHALSDWFTGTLWPGISSFFTSLPGKIKGALSDLWSAMKAPFVDAWDKHLHPWFVETWDKISAFFKAIPGYVTAGLAGLWAAFTGPFSTAWNWINNNIVKPAKEFFAWLAGKSAQGSATVSGLSKTAQQTATWGAPKKAAGGFSSGPEVVLWGEAGRELMLPLTKPKRTAELMAQAGLGGTQITGGVQVYITGQGAAAGEQAADAFLNRIAAAGVRL